MPVHIPNRARGAKSKALARVINTTASRLQYGHGSVALIVSHLFEAIIDEVRRGNSVMIRGVGCFGSRRFHSPGDPHGHCIPSFAPARGFRHEVRNALQATQATDLELRRYRRAHRIGTAKGRTTERCWAIQVKVRQEILEANYGSVELD